MTRFLAACRHLLVIPVIGCVLLTAGTVIMGIIRIVTAGAMLVRAAPALGSRRPSMRAARRLGSHTPALI